MLLSIPAALDIYKTTFYLLWVPCIKHAVIFKQVEL